MSSRLAKFSWAAAHGVAKVLGVAMHVRGVGVIVYASNVNVE